MRSDRGAASGFQRQRLLIALVFSCFVFCVLRTATADYNTAVHHGIGSRTSLMFLVHVRGAEPSPVYSLRWGKALFAPIFTL